MYSKLGRDFMKSSYKMSIPYIRKPGTKTWYHEFKIDSFDDPFKYTTDNLFEIQIGLGISRNLFFYGAMKDIMQRLFETGVTQYILFECYKNTTKNLEFKIHNKQEAYSVLTMKELYPGFFIWLGMIVVCVIVFIVEIVVFKVNTKILKGQNHSSVQPFK